jgi:hypothetical protein
MNNAKNNLLFNQMKQKSKFDKNRTAHEFQAGDYVIYDVPTKVKGEPPKLLPKAKGPYIILSRQSDNSLIIRKVGAIGEGEKVSSRLLRKYIPPETQSSSSSSSSNILQPPPLAQSHKSTDIHKKEKSKQVKSVQNLDTDNSIIPPPRPPTPPGVRRSQRIKSKIPSVDPDLGCHSQRDEADHSVGISGVWAGWCCPDCYFTL